jgi:hypothetical protein
MFTSFLLHRDGSDQSLGPSCREEFSAIGEREVGADPAIGPILGLKALDDNLGSRRQRILREA